MGEKKTGYEAFRETVDVDRRAFVDALHQDFLQAGCKLELKEAKSGFVVSYVLNRKTIANYVFRKKGLIIRIYAGHIQQYMDTLESLPAGMVKEIAGAPDCKRLLNPDDCNPKCAMGYDFLMDGKRYQKCRNSAFMFLVCEAYEPFIQGLVRRELAACG